jgi:hypothetical protein
MLFVLSTARAIPTQATTTVAVTTNRVVHPDERSIGVAGATDAVSIASGAPHIHAQSPRPVLQPDVYGTAGCARAAVARSAASSAASAAVAAAATAAQAASIPWSRFRAVTVVHEPCSTLSFTLTNFAGNLGPDWPILVIYTPRAKEAILDNKAVRYLARYGGLHTLPLSSLAIPGLDELTDVTEYSRLLARSEFWEALHAEKALVFQVDSVLCSASTWTIDDFLSYDYVGAPWVHADHIVGNGGLSLRSVNKMLHITREFRRNPHPEDLYFVEGLAAMAHDDAAAVIRAPTAVAERFAFEMDVPPDVVPFGVHRSVIVPADTKTAIIAGCPEAKVGVWTSCGRGM